MTGREKYLRAFDAFALTVPADLLTWAENELSLTRRVSPEPGRYRIDSRPYMKGFFEALQDGQTRTVVACFGTQCGKTLAVSVWLAYRVANDPAPALVVMPTEQQARSFSETRLRELFDSSPAVRAKYPADGDRLKILEMHFTDSTLNLCGSNSPAEVSSKPIALLSLDEVDKFAPATATESSAMHLAMERTKAFSRAKHIITSTPTTIYGDIWQQFLKGTQERYHIKCPTCGKLNTMDFRRDVRWDQEARLPSGQWNLARVAETARWHCPDCDAAMTSADKLQAIQEGAWVPSNPTPHPGYRSFHLSSIYSPTITFAAMALKFLSSQGDPAALQNFVNGWLAEPFEQDGTGATDDNILQCRGSHLKGTCPIEPLTITITADPGQTQTHWIAAGWTEAGECYVIDYGTVLAPEDLVPLINEKSWRAPSGKVEQISQGMVDSGDFTERIYGVCNYSGVLYPSKGSGARDGQLVRASEVHGLNALLYTYSDYHSKVALYIDRLQKHLSPRVWLPADSDTEFLRGFMGQRLVLPKNGKFKEWRKVANDHYGDCLKLQTIIWRILSH